MQNKRIFTDATIKAEFSKISTTDLRKILSHLLHENLVMEKPIQELLELLDESDLLKIAGYEKSQADEEIKIKAELKTIAIQSVLQTKGKGIWKEIVPEIVHFLHHLMEMFITISGLNQMGPDKDNPFMRASASFEAKAKLDFYLLMLAYPSTIFWFIFTYTGVASVAATMTAATVLASIIFVAVYIRYLRPCPHTCNGLDNLSSDMLREEEDPIFWRRDILKKIENAFLSGKGVVLTGESGSGKTTIVRSWAQYSATEECPKILRNREIFTTNAGNLKSVGDPFNSTTFPTVEAHFKNYRFWVMFFFDEIASLFTSDGIVGDISKQLLTFCDKFPYVITATTQKEYDQFMKGKEPFERRLLNIKLDSPLKKEIEVSLYEYLHKQAPQTLLGKGVIAYIVEKAQLFNPKTSVIDGAHSLLYRALNTQVLSFQELEQEIHNLSTEIELMDMTLFYKTGAVDQKIYQKNKTKLVEKKAEQQKSIKKLQQIKKIEKIYLKISNESYVVASKYVSTKCTNVSLKQTWLKLEILTQILEQAIIDQRKHLGLPPLLNIELIDKILTEKAL